MDNPNSKRPVWWRIVYTTVGALFMVARGVRNLVPQPLVAIVGRLLSILRPVLPVLVFGGFFFISNAGKSPGPREVMYSDFMHLVRSGNVSAALFESNGNRVYFTLKPHSSVMQKLAQFEAEAEKAAKEKRGARPDRAESLRRVMQGPEATRAEPAAPSPTAATDAVVSVQSSKPRVQRQFYALRVPEGDTDLVSALQAADVRFGAVSPSFGAAVSKILLTVLALWVPLLPMFFIFQRQFGGRNDKRKGQGKGSPQKPPVTFADVAGVNQAKEELMEAVMCLRDATRYSKLNAQMPSGVLLAGPPGTGKTLLAKAVAGEAGTPFFSASASEFVEMYVGRGAARVRELFAEARKAAPSVVFIDELDAVGAKRGMGFNEERDQTLNQLLTELDGFDGRPGVLVIAATNRPETLDPALLRPGRLTRRVTVPLPDEEGRRDILRVHLRRVPLQGVMLEEAAETLARITPNCSGAELANVVNEGALMAGRRGADGVVMADLLEGVQRTRFGVNGGNRGGSLPQWATSLMQSVTSSNARAAKLRNVM